VPGRIQNAWTVSFLKISCTCDDSNPNLIKEN
jgi:hypothetical protein